jgi:hypothetical protein
MTSLIRRSLLSLCAILLIGSLASCSENSTEADPPKPLVSGPGYVQFGSTPVGLCKDTTIRYDNNTGKKVTITEVTLSGSGFSWIGTELPVEVANGGSIDLKVRFCPSKTDTSKSIFSFKGTGGTEVNVLLLGYSGGQIVTFGSTFTFATFLTNGTGVKQPGTDAIEVHTITGVNQFFEGKTNVVTSSDGQVEDHFAAESNGDISTFLPTDLPVIGGLIGGWRQLPFGSKKQNVELLRKDTSLTVPQIPVPVPVTVKQVASYTGTTSLVVNGVTYSVENVTLTTTVTPALALLGNLTVVIKMGYIPNIGYLGTYNSTTVSTFAALPLDDGISKTLTTFDIK